MEKTTLTVRGMSCEHCAAAVTAALRNVPGLTGVTVDLKSGAVSFGYDPGTIALAAVTAAIAEAGYEVVD